MEAVKVINFPSKLSQLEADESEIASHLQAAKDAWIAYIRRVIELKKSKRWKARGFTRWEDYCEEYMEFKDSTYREAEMNIPIAELANSVANTTLSREQANSLGKKLNDVIPEAERIPMKLSVLALCYAAFPDKPVPDRNIIQEAYDVLKEERDSHTISVNGETFDYKETAQVKRLKERMTQDIQAHDKRITIAIENSREMALFRRLLRRLKHPTPNEDKKLFISWKD